ncbi:MAG: MerR family transcriptional regulator [Actinomycetota bacterium]|nr:MerR family transcriptional regulator [Actinomycetota bacterium]
MDELLTIGQMARRTGVNVPTLRMWEERHGFPRPERLASGHRRYGTQDCEAVTQVVRLRESGLSLEAAIARALTAAAPQHTSLFAALRSHRPDLSPWLARKAALVAISHAIEDECTQRAEPAVLVGSFQRERFYRAAESRWRELGRTASASLVFADFDDVREPVGAPAEIPLERTSPLQREWAIIWDAPAFSVCLAASERPGQTRVAGSRRVFEAIWTTEPELVRAATTVALGICSGPAPELAAGARMHLQEPRLADGETLRAATALTNRIVSYLA